MTEPRRMSSAAVFTGRPGELVLQEFAIPEPRGAEVLVRVLGCTLCGSDLHSLYGRRPAPAPGVLGHEIVGAIEAFGPTASRHDARGEPLAAGDRITWSLTASCGECFFCRRQLPQKCLQGGKYGHQAAGDQPLTGGLAEHCLLWAGTSLVKLPDELPLAAACPANCAIATAVAAADTLGDMAGRTVGVVGAGMLGLAATALLSHRGAEVIVIEVQEPRRATALQFGAAAAVTPEEAAAEAAARTEHGLEAVLEMSGATAGMETAWPLVRIGGAIAAVGAVSPARPFPMALDQLVRRQLNVHGVHNYRPDQLLQAVDFLAECHSTRPFADLVAAWHPLANAAEAAEQAAAGEAIRVGVKMT